MCHFVKFPEATVCLQTWNQLVTETASCSYWDFQSKITNSSGTMLICQVGLSSQLLSFISSVHSLRHTISILSGNPNLAKNYEGKRSQHEIQVNREILAIQPGRQQNHRNTNLDVFELFHPWSERPIPNCPLLNSTTNITIYEKWGFYLKTSMECCD